jgi:hypothetical protein
MGCNLQILKIDRYANLVSDTLGMDCEQHCFNPLYYRQYPHQVLYQFNELGFRTQSPNQMQGNEILAIGDSFTLGLGVAQCHTWSAQLAQELNYPVLNFSLNGASNDWMVRKTSQLLTVFSPRCIVVHYTFSHRRERPFPDWHDDERTECEPLYSDQENYQNWQQAFDYFSSLGVPVVHSFISDWHTQPVDYAQLPGKVISPMSKIDLARDGFHYGVETHRRLAKKITSLLAV